MAGLLGHPENNFDRDAGLVSCVAIVAVRNEARYLPTLLKGLLDQGIDVVVLDNDSDDGSKDIFDSFAGDGRLRVERLPWSGSYDLAQQLRAKQAVIAKLTQQWVISLDADEWPQSPVSDERLREGITRINRLGYNAINFDEFVFLPVSRAAAEDEGNYDFRRENLHYYFFAPFPQRLMRAWRIDGGFSNVDSGGHKLTGHGLNVAPENFILRHYIGLSQAHIMDKYSRRVYSKANQARGWHGNRVGLTAAQLQFPRPQQLHQLSDFRDKRFDRSRPQKKHYWSWGFKRYPGAYSALKNLLTPANNRQ